MSRPEDDIKIRVLERSTSDYRAFKTDVLACLEPSPMWHLDNGVAGQDGQRFAQSSALGGRVHHSQGPDSFLVSAATRSQVLLRKSVPKYARLARLHTGSHGSVF